MSDFIDGLGRCGEYRGQGGFTLGTGNADAHHGIVAVLKIHFGSQFIEVQSRQYGTYKRRWHQQAVGVGMSQQVEHGQQSALGAAVPAELSLPVSDGADVIGELTLEKPGRICADGADDAPMGQVRNNGRGHRCAVFRGRIPVPDDPVSLDHRATADEKIPPLCIHDAALNRLLSGPIGIYHRQPYGRTDPLGYTNDI